MKLVIFGATGGTGIPLVQKALEAGHSVTALVRTPSKLTISHAALTVVQGDATNAQDVINTIAPDTEAVISVLGPVKGQPANMISSAAQNILTAMTQRDVNRLIWMTGAGVRFPQDKPGLMDHVMGFLLKTMAGDVLAESEKAVRAVQASDRKWTIVRVPRLTSNPATGAFRVGWVGVNTGMQITRADSATFILQELAENKHIRQAPMISN
jgi:putative NADH-flavin reductase